MGMKVRRYIGTLADRLTYYVYVYRGAHKCLEAPHDSLEHVQWCTNRSRQVMHNHYVDHSYVCNSCYKSYTSYYCSNCPIWSKTERSKLIPVLDITKYLMLFGTILRHLMGSWCILHAALRISHITHTMYECA